MADQNPAKGHLIKAAQNRRQPSAGSGTVKPVNRERLAKTIFKPWPVARIFQAAHHELVDREWELTRIINAVTAERDLIKQRLTK